MIQKTIRRSFRLALSLLLVSAAGLTACGETITPPPGSEENEQKGETTPAPLNETVYVDVETFESLREEGAPIPDVRAEEAYGEGHVPGAVEAPWSALKDDDREGAFIERDPAKLREKVRQLGIDEDQKVLVYAGAISTLAARQAWSLEFAGLGDVYILNGGYKTWLKEASVDPSTTAPNIEKGDAEVAVRSSIRATGEDVQKAVEGERPAILFDSRSEDEYEGTDERDNPRHGHVPNAIHYNWKNVFTEAGKLRPKSELRAELEEKGLLKENSVIIPYCQGGFRSAVVYSVLRWLGHDDAQNYDGSWWEWSRNNNVDVETK